jgi:hypothetical protein
MTQSTHHNSAVNCRSQARAHRTPSETGEAAGRGSSVGVAWIIVDYKASHHHAPQWLQTFVRQLIRAEIDLSYRLHLLKGVQTVFYVPVR